MEKIKLRGIERNLSDDQMKDGACEELINMRIKDESLRIAPTKEISFTTAQDYVLMYKHYIPEATNDFFVVRRKDMEWISLYYPETSSEVLVLSFPGETFLNVSSLGIFLRVCTDKNVYILKWNYETDGYNLLKDIITPKAYFDYSADVQSCGNKITKTTTLYSSQLKETISIYQALVAKMKEKGKIEGHICLRLAFKLWDGTYIKHSSPYYLLIGESDYYVPNPDPLIDHEEMIFELRDLGGEDDHNAHYFLQCTFGSPTFQLRIDDTFTNLLEKYDGLIKELVVFATPEVSRYNVSNSPDDYLLYWTGGLSGSVGATRYLYKVPMNDSVEKSFPDQANYYRVHSIAYNDLINMESGSTQKIDLGDYSIVETKESLPIDNFSHQSLVSDVHYVYNERLHLGNIKTIFKIANDPTWWGPAPENNYQVGAGPLGRVYYLEWTVKTDKGIKYIREIFNPTIYDQIKKEDPWSKIYMSWISYPDNRATRMRILVKNNSLSTTWYKVADYDLTSHPFLNIAIKTNWRDDYSIFSYISAYVHDSIYSHNVVLVEDENVIYTDTNRVQVSEQNNLLEYKAIHSYQVHNEDIIVLGISSQSMPLSEGQFGQFPLYIFSSGGIWYMVQGSGEVLYERILPLNKEVAVEGSVLSLGDVVLYCTTQSVKILSGRESINISKLVEGDVTNPLMNLPEYQSFTDDAENVEIDAYLSEGSIGVGGISAMVDFSRYLEQAIVGYDHINEEIIISNSNYDYSYVYNKLSKAWHKVSAKYDRFILDPSGNLAKDGSTIYWIENEEQDAEVDMFFQTRPFNFETTIYKKIERLILRLRSVPQTGKRTFMLLYGSVNGTDYKMLRSINTDDDKVHKLLTRQVRASCRYYILVWGVKSWDTAVDGIEVDLVPTENNKIR